MKLLRFLWMLAPVFTQHVNVSPLDLKSNPCTDSKHVFLAPGVLSAGGTNRACISRFHPDGPANLQVTLVSANQVTTTASRELPPGDGGCVDIAVPLEPNTKAKLIASMWYPESQCSWSQELVVRVGSGRVVVLQTERPRYRPGETLRARVFALKADLTPVHGPVDEIWLEGPQGAWAGTRAAQWQRVRTRMGIAQIQHDIDELAPPGRWTLRAKLADGSQGAAAFTVGNYELPPFQMTVRHAQKVLRSSERLVWTVCVRYPWSEAVEGMLIIRIRSVGGRAAGSGEGIRTAVRLRARPCHRHAAAARRVRLRAAHMPHVVVADFSFQEDGTRVWQNTTVVSQIVDKPISLEFLTKHRAVISPRLPYKLKVKATRWDDKPAPNQRVRVCRTASKWPPSTDTKWPPETPQNATCFEGDTDEAGIARVTFTASDNDNKYYTFEASLHNDSATTAPPLHATAAGARAALGPLRAGAGGAARVPLYVALPAVTEPLSVHFVVITRGGIIYRWGATTQCPTTSSADYVPTTSRHHQCHDSYAANVQNSPRYYSNTTNIFTNSINYGTDKKYGVETSKFGADQTKFDTNEVLFGSNSTLENDPDSLVDRHLLRVILPIKVTHQMCPDSHLIAYFYHDGELISASKHFEMDECFINKVEISWASRQVRPGAEATLQVSSGAAALCALSALDAAAAPARASGALRTAPVDGLRRLAAARRNLTEYDAPHCQHSIEDPELMLSGVNALEVWMSRAGVRVGSNKSPSRSSKCTRPAPMIDDTPLPRSDFSEAWLWRLVSVSANGTASATGRAPHSVTRHEAGAVCVTRAGLAAPRPAVLQVFREFFIHADTPQRLKRGDTAIVRYRIFNYLYEPLSVQIDFQTDSRLAGPQTVEQACVGPRSSIARRAELSARELGLTSVHVRAVSVDDGRCSNATRAGVTDEVVFQITVDPEGVPEQDQKSILLCGKGSEDSSQHEVSWSWPRVQAVPGTEALTVWVAGDLTGPLLADADALVNLPRGCGEQNMARLATNLLAVTHLDPASPAAAVAKEHVARGFTRQLQYVHPSGGFSAFGPSDPAPSTWLTAFCLRYMHPAHQLLYPGVPRPPALERAERWLLSQQMENGCFRNEGQVFHRELKGGLSEGSEAGSVSLTAYAVASLAISRAPLSPRRVADATRCLRELPPATSGPAVVYARALRAYARAALRRYGYGPGTYTTNESNLRDKGFVDSLSEEEETRELTMLLKVARRAGDRVWWETSSLSSSVEATAYALLALSMRPSTTLPQLSLSLSQSSSASPTPPSLSLLAADYGRAAARWLAEHRNAQGGFISTQDTLVALEALTAWSAAQPAPPANLTVTARSGALTRAAEVRPSDRVPELMTMGSGQQLHVSVEGSGCALVQATRSYNSKTANTRGSELTVQVAVHTDGPFDCDNNGTHCFCAAVVQACVSWVGEFPAMALLEVWLPAASADAALLYRQLTPQDPILRRIELSASGGRVTFYLSGAGADGSACYEVPAVGPRGRSAPARARVLDYYAPHRNHTQMYTIPEDCPPRISHKINNDYIASDNLFSKAKSLTDSEEIVITHEFSFEDIPEGIPLDDPIYDTLNRDEIGYLARPDEIYADKKIDFNITDANNMENHSHISDTDNIKTINLEIPGDIQQEPSNMTHYDKNHTGLIKTANMGIADKYYGQNNKENITINADKEIITSTNRTAFDYENITKTEDVINNYSSHESYSDLSVKINDVVNNYEIENRFENLSSKCNDTATNISNNNVPLNSEDVFRNDMLPGYVEHEIKNPEIENPSISNFHVIETAVDLEVPPGVEGPIPSIVLPPPNFVLPPRTFLEPEFIPPTYPRRQPNYYYSYFQRNHMNRRYATPVG